MIQMAGRIFIEANDLRGIEHHPSSQHPQSFRIKAQESLTDLSTNNTPEISSKTGNKMRSRYHSPPSTPSRNQRHSKEGNATTRLRHSEDGECFVYSCEHCGHQNYVPEIAILLFLGNPDVHRGTFIKQLKRGGVVPARFYPLVCTKCDQVDCSISEDEVLTMVEQKKMNNVHF